MSVNYYAASGTVGLLLVLVWLASQSGFGLSDGSANRIYTVRSNSLSRRGFFGSGYSGSSRGYSGGGSHGGK